jgi:YidC/Oxa1 family membrane protein insertase
MLYFFPGFFTFIMLQVPAGLTLYIFVNNLLSIIQQQAMLKKMPPAAPAAAVPAK